MISDPYLLLLIGAVFGAAVDSVAAKSALVRGGNVRQSFRVGLLVSVVCSATLYVLFTVIRWLL